MTRAVFGGHAAKAYPELRMLSADTGEQVLMAEPGMTYDFPDHFESWFDEDDIYRTESVATQPPADGLWLPEGTQFTPTLPSPESPQEEGSAAGQGPPPGAASGADSGAGSPAAEPQIPNLPESVPEG